MAVPVSIITLGVHDSRRTDAAAVLLQAQLREHRIFTSPEAVRSGLDSISHDPTRGFILLAESGARKIIGTVYAVSLVSLEHGGMSGWIEELYVMPAWRGRGVGSQLLGETTSVAKHLGWKALDLEIDAEHARAESLYSRNGFTPVTRKRYCRVL